MPTEDFHPHPAEEFDPDKTLFFQRRKKRVNLLPLIVGCSLVLGSGALIAWAVSQSSKSPPEDVSSAADQSGETVNPVGIARAVPAGSLTPFEQTKPVQVALPVDPAASEPPPTVPDASMPLNLDVKDPGNAQVRDEVLRRIDLMPGVSAGNKDKLYASVDHARGMGRVLTIPFVKGETAIRAADVEHLKHQLESPQIRPMADDPTVVFVVLGYADPKGSEKLNAEISLNRAHSVLDALRGKCGLQNVMHSVAMGGSTLFGTQQMDKNRVAEVWAVLP